MLILCHIHHTGLFQGHLIFGFNYINAYFKSSRKEICLRKNNPVGHLQQIEFYCMKTRKTPEDENEYANDKV